MASSVADVADSMQQAYGWGAFGVDEEDDVLQVGQCSTLLVY